jgi:pimeloyl-ACP methyl ester carboxylesterase
MTANRTDKQFKLRDGRMLGYSEYGDPDGMPVFYFHGHPGSRHDWPSFDSSDVATDLKARIIAAERPGHGISDFKPDRKILDWPDDVVELAEALNINRFAVLGISGGGPYAAACAFKIPNRITATAIVCGMGPADAPGVESGIAWKFAAGRSWPMRRIMLTLMSFGLRKNPEMFVSQVNDAMKGPDKAVLLARPELAKEMIEVSFAEAFRQGITGVCRDAELYSRPWGFQLEDITSKIHLWHGEQDENVPVLVGRYVANAIPNCQARFVEDEGHMSLPFNYVREYLSALVP